MAQYSAACLVDSKAESKENLRAVSMVCYLAVRLVSLRAAHWAYLSAERMEPQWAEYSGFLTAVPKD